MFLSFNNTDRTPFLYRHSQNPNAADTFSSKNRHQTPISHLHYRYDYVLSFTRLSSIYHLPDFHSENPKSQSKETDHKLCGCAGGASGIGLETTRVLTMRGANVIIAARNIKAANEAKQTILKNNDNAKIDVLKLDLSSLNSVNAFVHTFKALDLPLNILINNVGVMFCPYQLSQDGIEMQFATNHQEEGVNITVNSVHPGLIMTDLMRHSFLRMSMRIFKLLTYIIWKTVPQGVATTCYVAVHPNLKGVSGKYFQDYNEYAAGNFTTDYELVKKLCDYSQNFVNSLQHS
ncbi:putative very-long-chain 3-oxoacyl-CoA reductase [Helianthus anomalus]